MPLGITGADGPHFTVRPEIRIDKLFGPAESIDLSDRLLSFDISASKEDAASTGTFTFSRGSGQDSLSPAVTDSTLTVEGRPALDPGLWVYLYVSINGAYRQLLWLGRIHRVNAAVGTNKVTVVCRDFAAVALNLSLRYTYLQPDTTGIINAITLLATTAATQNSSDDLLLGRIIEPEPTGWIINPYTQEEMSTMEGARRLVQTMGGDIRVIGRYGFDKLAIVPVVRALAFPGMDATLGPGRYETITELAWGDDEVRNQWEGWYQHPTTGLPVGPIYVEDAASIALHGPKYARVYLDRANNIDTDPEMTAYLGAALADNKDPLASHRITMAFFPDVELDDVHRYLANDDEYDRDLILAVVGYTHHWEANQKPGDNFQPTTTISARGSRIGAYREYRRSVPPKSIVTTLAPTTEYAPEGTVIYVRAA